MLVSKARAATLAVAQVATLAEVAAATSAVAQAVTLAEVAAAAISVAAAAAISNVLDSRGDLKVAPNLLSSQFLPSRLHLAQALLLSCQFLTLILNNLRPGPANRLIACSDFCVICSYNCGFSVRARNWMSGACASNIDTWSPAAISTAMLRADSTFIWLRASRIRTITSCSRAKDCSACSSIAAALPCGQGATIKAEAGQRSVSGSLV